MVINTYYWRDRVIGPAKILLSMIGKGEDTFFRFGNSGDIYNRDLLRHQYRASVRNIEVGSRLLCVGSIAHLAKPGDVLCGTGIKSPDHLPRVQSTEIKIIGLRGPKSLRAAESSGLDVSGIRFLADPGILIAKVHGLTPEMGRAEDFLFIPHYRERSYYRRNPPQGFRIFDIDNPTRKVAQAILDSKFVASSSLHGLIFAHALGRPTVAITPRTSESSFKYEDYYQSLGIAEIGWQEYPTVKGIAKVSDTPLDISGLENSCVLPRIDELKGWGVVH